MGKFRSIRVLLFTMAISCVFALTTYAESTAPPSKIIQGKLAPEFQFNLIGSNELITKEKMLGKVYLIDFWKTTCSKCQEKMPFLHELYDCFKEKGLQIISISLDKNPDEVELYRKSQWKMPWLHTIVPDGWNSELVQKFEVKHIPKLILVGTDGNIICTTEKISEDDLKRNLERIFN